MKPTAQKRSTNSTPRKRRSCILSSIQLSSKYVDELGALNKTVSRDLKEISPFPHWQFRQFVDNMSNIVEAIEDELQNFEAWRRKENDLYSLYQTEDFRSLDIVQHPALFAFRQFMYGTVREWLSEVTGVDLKPAPDVDMNGSCYSETDGLLPHNDLIGTRHFAFVYYLTPFKWQKKYGGSLLLFNSNDLDEPTTVAKSLDPTRNSLVVFEVSTRSWHQVAELLSDQPRLSINGWFHSDRKIEPKVPRPRVLPKLQQLKKSLDISPFFNKSYFDDRRLESACEKFGESSEICLQSFLKDETAVKLVSELNSLPFEAVGPPSKRSLSQCRLEEVKKGQLAIFSKVLRSEKFRELIERITGCDLKGHEISTSVTKLDHGSYSVAGDEDAEQAANDGYSLDVHLYIADPSAAWPENVGGDIIYVGKGDDEELIHIAPAACSAALVLRDPEVFSFMKFVNNKAPKNFYHIVLSYWNVTVENDDDQDEEEEEP